MGMGVLAAGSPVLNGLRALAEEPHPSKMPLNDLTDQDEVALGDILAADVEKELPIVTNSLVDNYLNGIVQKLAAVSQRPNLPYKCKLVNEEVLNAFSIAGGHIYIYRGLVENLSKEDELVATLSHEIGHVVGHHSANKLILNMKARQAYDLVKSNIPEHAKAIQEFIEKIGGGLAVLAMLQYSRSNEYEADKLGFYETLRAGWDPNGFLSLFDMFAAYEKQSTGMPIPLLRDHPPSEDRAAAIRKELTEVTVPKDADTDSLSFHAFKLAMNLLPEPPKPPDAAPTPKSGSGSGFSSNSGSKGRSRLA
jgi:predicted Zn-dependent protease